MVFIHSGIYSIGNKMPEQIPNGKIIPDDIPHISPSFLLNPARNIYIPVEMKSATVNIIPKSTTLDFPKS